jgi:hypothetical protein
MEIFLICLYAGLCFEPGRDDRLILATEAGIYSTDLVNGVSTVWMPNTTFPTVLTDMIRIAYQ